MYKEENYKQGEKVAFRMGENTSKQNNWQRLYLQNIQAAHAAQFSSVAQLDLTLCNCMDCSMPGLPITNSWSLLKLLSIESVTPSNHLILCRPFLLLPSIFPSSKIFSNESVLHMRWPKYCSFSLVSVLSMNTQDWSPLGWTGWISLLSKELSRVFSNTTVQKHSLALSFLCNPTLTSIHDHWKNHSLD